MCWSADKHVDWLSANKIAEFSPYCLNWCTVISYYRKLKMHLINTMSMLFFSRYIVDEDSYGMLKMKTETKKYEKYLPFKC